MSRRIVGITFAAVLVLLLGGRATHHEVHAQDLGDLAVVGDSITQGGNAHPSYRYELFKHLVGAGATYNFVGSITGAYQFNAGATPDYLGQTFQNVHDGHWGWRSFWENGRVPLPSSRTSNNRGTGAVENWTGQTTQYELDTAGNWVTYTGTTYTPDTVIAMIGINDLSSGSATATLLSDVELLVDQFQAANPDVDIYLTSLLPVGSGHSQFPALNVTVDNYNSDLAAAAPGWSTATSTVGYLDVTTDFDADTMTYDNVHPNLAGEQFIATQTAVQLGLINPPGPLGDLTGDGLISLDDWLQFKVNYGTDTTGMTAADQEDLGDLNTDNIINLGDFVIFGDQYDLFNGTGAFTALLAGVPEPGSFVLAISGLVLSCGYRPPRQLRR